MSAPAGGAQMRRAAPKGAEDLRGRGFGANRVGPTPLWRQLGTVAYRCADPALRRPAHQREYARSPSARRTPGTHLEGVRPSGVPRSLAAPGLLARATARTRVGVLE